MAKTPKKSANSKTPQEKSAPKAADDAVIEDAIVLEDPSQTEAPQTEAPQDEAPQDEAETQTAPETDMSTQDTPEPAEASDQESHEDAPTADAPETPETPETPPVAPPAPQSKDKGIFLPLIFGGAVAAALGYGASYIGLMETTQSNPFETETRSTLAEQGADIAELSNKISGGVATPEDLQSLVAELTALKSESSQALSQLGSLSAQLNETDARITEVSQLAEDITARIDALEKRPMAEGASESAIAAYERELAALQSSVEEQRADLQATVDAQRAEIQAIADQAAAREKEAEAIAQAGLEQAALAKLMTALDAGAPFAGALGEYTAVGGAEGPQVLTDLAEKGIPTLASLQDSFPDAARAALAAARSPEANEGAGGLGTFLARRLGARSVTPREGTDPDAVLSRAEAAVINGDVQGALTEIEGLPASAKDALASWIETANQRQAAMAAAASLAERTDSK